MAFNPAPPTPTSPAFNVSAGVENDDMTVDTQEGPSADPFTNAAAFKDQELDVVDLVKTQYILLNNHRVHLNQVYSSLRHLQAILSQDTRYYSKAFQETCKTAVDIDDYLKKSRDQFDNFKEMYSRLCEDSSPQNSETADTHLQPGDSQESGCTGGPSEGEEVMSEAEGSSNGPGDSNDDPAA